MGEKLYVISKVDLPGLSFDVELNDGSAATNKTKYIHLQNERFRLALPVSQYLQMAVAVRSAAKKIREYKDLKEYENDQDR